MMSAAGADTTAAKSEKAVIEYTNPMFPPNITLKFLGFVLNSTIRVSGPW
jgi:hypothetical protein